MIEALISWCMLSGKKSPLEWLVISPERLPNLWCCITNYHKQLEKLYPPPPLAQGHRQLWDHLLMVKFLESLTQTDSNNCITIYVKIWFPLIRYFSSKNLIPPRTSYEHLLYFWIDLCLTYLRTVLLFFFNLVSSLLFAYVISHIVC